MCVDAIRRRAETYWPWIIIAVPGGSLLYFVMVRSQDHDAQILKRRLLNHLSRPPSVEDLKHALDETPSINNRLTYGQGLADAGRYAEAQAEFEKVLSVRPKELDALFGIGVCCIELGNAGEAIAPLRRIVEEAPTYRDCSVYGELAEALAALGEVEEALQLLRDLAKAHPRIGHDVLLATYLRKAGQGDEASQILRVALRRYDDAPQHYRRQNRGHAREARRMLAA